jgi:hypothetical protein
VVSDRELLIRAVRILRPGGLVGGRGGARAARFIYVIAEYHAEYTCICTWL